jgi:hypothetical protein
VAAGVAAVVGVGVTVASSVGTGVAVASGVALAAGEGVGDTATALVRVGRAVRLAGGVVSLGSAKGSG